MSKQSRLHSTKTGKSGVVFIFLFNFESIKLSGQSIEGEVPFFLPLEKCDYDYTKLLL